MTQTELYLWDVIRSFSLAIELIFIFGLLLLFAMGLFCFICVVVEGYEYFKRNFLDVFIKPAKISVSILSILLVVILLTPSATYIDTITSKQETK